MENVTQDINCGCGAEYELVITRNTFWSYYICTKCGKCRQLSFFERKKLGLALNSIEGRTAYFRNYF